MPAEKACFVIAPIGEPESDTRKRSDQVLKHVIKPAVGECGYKAIRADEIDKPGIITSQVIQHVVNDPLVCADLTERNPNVFYELAIRHALGKPFVQLMKRGEQIPFDVAATRTIFVDHRDLDSVAEAKKKIIDQIRELEKDQAEIETPISVSLDLQSLRQSEKPEDRSLADLVAAVSNIRADLGKLETKIETLDNEDEIDSLQRAIRGLPRQLAGHFGAQGSTLPIGGRPIHPGMVDELLSISSRHSDAMELLIFAGLLREILPWAYELAMETYRLLRTESIEEARERLNELQEVLKYSLHSRLSRDLIGSGGEESVMMLEYLDHRLERFVERLTSPTSTRRRRRLTE